MVSKVWKHSSCPYIGGKGSPEVASSLIQAMLPASSSDVRAESNTGRELTLREAVYPVDTSMSFRPRKLALPCSSFVQR